jgi:hypothetical protein
VNVCERFTFTSNSLVNACRRDGNYIDEDFGH